jgi:REP element-mobilizing transposase RayT
LTAPKAQHSTKAWGNAPDSCNAKGASAESAIHFRRQLLHHSRVPQSLSKVILHIIFSTKNREPWLDSAVRPRMHAYLATICRDLGAEFVRVGGVADHVHIVATLPRTVSQAEMIEQIKKTSSKWIKALGVRYRGFFWQRGYGAFSVSPSQLDAVLQYVEAQQEHHRTRTFQEEYRELLRRHGVDFEERYVWD